MCKGGCHDYSSPLDQTTKPSSLTTPAETVHLSHHNSDSPWASAAKKAGVVDAKKLGIVDVKIAGGHMEGRSLMSATPDLLLPAV
jgi:hypothetical protein